MTQISFKEYLCLSEDATAELSQLQLQRQQLVMKKTVADRQIDVQISNIDKMIYQKEKLKQAEDKKNGVQQNGQPNQQDARQQMGNRTVQPGSSGSQTPGSSPAPQQGTMSVQPS